MRDERKHGATAQALKEAAILYAAEVEGFRIDRQSRSRTWDTLRKAAIRYATNPRPEGRPRK